VLSFARSSVRSQREELLKSASRWVQHALELNRERRRSARAARPAVRRRRVYFRDASLLDLAWANYEKAKRINKQNLSR
jgi:hypothetical protein